MSQARPETSDPEPQEYEEEEHDHVRRRRARPPSFDRLPRWHVSTWLHLGTVIASIVAACVGVAITRDHVAALEEWRAQHEKTDKEERDVAASHLERIESEFGVVRSDHGTRITLLEDRYSSLLQVMSRVEKKLDDQQTLLLRRQR